MPVTLDSTRAGSYITLSDGDMTAACSTASKSQVPATALAPTVPYYFEMTINADSSTRHAIGLHQDHTTFYSSNAPGAVNVVYTLGIMSYGYMIQGALTNLDSSWPPWNSGDTVGLAVDPTNDNAFLISFNNEWWNGTSWVTAFPGLVNYTNKMGGGGNDIWGVVGRSWNDSSTVNETVNFGDSAFTTTLPSALIPYKGADPVYTANLRVKQKRLTNFYPLIGGI